MKTQIKVWSKIGNTPITKRGGSFCDVLVDAVIECESPDEARREVQLLIGTTPHGDYGHFYMPDYWNHNMRSAFVSHL